jgi:hypothetical protein
MEMINVRGVEIDKDESRRLHEDWWGECWTCVHWTGDMSGTGVVSSHAVLREGNCTNAKSKMHGKLTSTSGYCPKWDSWDVSTALEVLQERNGSP